MKFFIILLSLFIAAYGYSSMPRLVSRKSMSVKAFDMSTLTTAVEVVAKPDGYVYGEVAAPSFVLPLFAVLAVLTAAIPFLLRPGEQALDQQRVDEETTNSQFGRNRKKDL